MEIRHESYLQNIVIFLKFIKFYSFHMVHLKLSLKKGENANNKHVNKQPSITP